MRKLALFCGGFAAGIFLAQYALPDGWLLPGGLVCLGAGVWALLLPPDWRRRMVLCLVGAALALGWDWLYLRQVSAPMEVLVGSRQTLTMTLAEYPAETSFGAKVTVQAEELPGKLAYYGDSTLLQLTPGQRITDDVYLQSASRIRDDDVAVFNSKGVFLLAYSRGTPAFGRGDPEAVRWWPVRLGHRMQAQIRTLFSGNDAGFLLALVEFLTGKHRRRLTAAVSIPILIFYALLTGASPSVVRACVMLSLLTAAPLFRRESDPPTALLTALFLILAANPFAAKSVSLQLSFGAVTGLLWLSPKVYQGLMGTKKKHGRLTAATAASVSATTGCLALTAPVSAYYFGCFALVGFLSNLLCLWAVGIVFAGGLLAVLLSFAWLPLGMLVGLVPRLFIRYILAVCHALAALPYHGVYFCNPYLKWWMAFLYLLFAAAWLMKPKGRRKYAVAAAAGVLTLAVTVWAGTARFHHRLDVAAVDVGQGQSVILKSGTDFAVVDCGSGNSWRDAGCDTADQLLTMGCRSVERVILTHFDDDHINGVEHLLARINVEMLTVPEETENDTERREILRLAEQYGVAVETVTEKTVLSFGGGELTIFPPLGAGGSNELGLTILAAAGERMFLITGDMERATEKKLLDTYSLPDVDVLMAGHHGSRDSTSGELLEAVTPETVVISVGSNSYGHPAEDTLQRLARAGCRVYRTDHHGTVYISFD